MRRLFRQRQRARRFADLLQTTFRLRPELLELADDDTIVCRCEDVRWGELKQHPQLRSAKLQTRCGMGPCQGRVCHNILQTLTDWQPAMVS